MRDEVSAAAPGLPAFVEVTRDRVRLFLSEHRGDARPDTLVYLRIRDVETIASEFGVQAKDAPSEREIELRDPDGNVQRVLPSGRVRAARTAPPRPGLPPKSCER
ncbi:hypothetical protein GCM10015535_64430 [Streptomyces gelaticus]|uniref:Uncharacterized protein n=1 Tax=Streptomyces gelaticus TaxID=285446 RepID=A0ABQ2WAL4_9ACTN|nr:hypothetical protein GCM10015535_64430 [Streptomyces gelaticus]